MNDNSELTRQKLCNCLFDALASEGHSKDKCCELTAKYDQLTTDCKMSPSGAFGVIYAGYGSCNARDMLNQATRFIHDNLDSFNKFNPKVKLNSTSRFADLVARFNKNVASLSSIEINGVSLTADEIEKLKLPIPANVKTESFASDQTSKIKGLTLEITK